MKRRSMRAARSRGPPDRTTPGIFTSPGRLKAAQGLRWTGVCLELDLVDGLLHRLEGPLEHRLLVGREIDLVDLLHAALADRDGHAHVVPAHAVLALQPGGAGQHPLLVPHATLCQPDGAGGRTVERP